MDKGQTGIVRKNESSLVSAHSYKTKTSTSVIRPETRRMHILIVWRSNVGRSEICCIGIVDVVDHFHRKSIVLFEDPFLRGDARAGFNRLKVTNVDVFGAKPAGHQFSI